ncbi:arylsulfatase J-like [Panonychus citri]|uniref:arylsulfatase J-like n=1 Tax=Panonychus citri TaxID=50023 RepID=UPI002307786A|nr:arylsulfatase J-like [Panonychus citri]
MLLLVSKLFPIKLIVCTLIVSSLFQSICNHERPNILLIIVDDLGWDDLSYTGNDFISTPNIDTLAKEGVKLSNYYVQPICSPSRSSLLSGYHPIQTGMQHSVIAGDEPWGLSEQFQILPQYLKSLNYSTHLIGKWHQGFCSKKMIPIERGFDSYIGFLSGATDYYDRITRSNSKWGLDWYQNETRAADQFIGQHSTEIFTSQAIKLIESYSNSNDPWFIEISYQAVHIGNSPKLYQVPVDYFNRYSYINDINLRSYVALLSSLDDSIGKIFNSLHRYGQSNSTLIIFTSDNGAPTGTLNDKHTNLGVGSNQPLRGSKYTLWEGGIKGLSWVWANWLKSKGTIYSGLSHISDWLPTIYSFAGGNSSNLPGNLYGINLRYELEGNYNKQSANNETKMNYYSLRNELLHNIDDIWKVFSIRIGDYKIVSGSVLDGKFDDWVVRNFTNHIGKNNHQLVNYKSSSLKLPSTSSSWLTLNQSLYELDERSIERPFNLLRISCNNQTRNNCQPLREPCLFNIVQDPCEYNNIASNNKLIVNQMINRINELRQIAIKPVNKPSDPKAAPIYHGGYWTWWLS